MSTIARAPWAGYTRKHNEDNVRTLELPVVRYSGDMAPPSYPHPVRYRVSIVRNGDAQGIINSDKRLTVAYFDPREPIMIKDEQSLACHTERVGTRIIPLEYYHCEPAGALSIMMKYRRAGVSAGIGKQFLVISDELPQADVTILARGF